MTVPHLDVSANTSSRPSLHALANTTALGGQRFAEQDSADAVDEPHERVPPRLDRTQALIVAFQAQYVAPLAQRRPEDVDPMRSRPAGLGVLGASTARR